MFKSLISRVIVLNLLLLIVGIGVFALFHLRQEQAHLLDSTRENAATLLAIADQAIFTAMHAGAHEEAQAILETIGQNERLVNVRIFRPDGAILKSSRVEEIGRSVNPEELQVFQDHLGYGLFQVAGRPVLGIAKPIISDRPCRSCHGTERKILGVLGLNYSLTETDYKLNESTRLFVASAIAIILLLSGGNLILLRHFVRRPMQALAAQMAKVEQGDFSVRITPRFADEMGRLEQSFNSMVNYLEKAKQELELYHYRQMARADRLAAVGEMASGVAHEIKNPLAGIGGAVAVLANDFAENDPRKDIVREILEQLSRLNKTATDLLFFGRPGEPEFTYVDLNALVRKTLAFMTRHPESKQIRQIQTLDPGLPPVWADEKQLQQVLYNLMINGIQAMAGDGTLTIETSLLDRDDGRYGRIEIRDTGAGIPKEQLEKIFLPFYTTKTQGTGLGLAICRRLMEQQKGTIKVDSRCGEGTVFIIELPVTAGEPQNSREGCHASA